MKRKSKKGPPPPIDAWLETQVKKPIHIDKTPSISYCDSYNPETTLFISIATHASLLLDSEGMPLTTECHLRNLEKKNVANIGICSKRFMASPLFVNPDKILEILDTEVISSSRQRHLHSLSDEKYSEELLNILDDVLFKPETPIHLSSSIIENYEKSGCDFDRTFPTVFSIEQSYSLYLTLKKKIMGITTSLPIDPDIRQKFSCNIQKNKPTYWINVYNLENVSNIYDSIVFSFILRGERKFYNIFFKNELNRLFRDLIESRESREVIGSREINDYLSDESVSEDELVRSIRFIKSNLKRKENKTKKYIYYTNIDTNDLFNISQLLQDFFNIEKILITDFSCKSTDNPEKDLEYKDLPLGYGGKRLK